jgi:hypothetical protein
MAKLMRVSKGSREGNPRPVNRRNRIAEGMVDEKGG